RTWCPWANCRGGNMKRTVLKLGGLGLVVLLGACDAGPPERGVSAAAPAPVVQTDIAPGSAGATITDCDRVCLEGFVDLYVAALVAHDPSRAPFAEDAKFTENAQVLELGDALWGTANAPPAGYQLKVGDPSTGNVAFFLLME